MDNRNPAPNPVTTIPLSESTSSTNIDQHHSAQIDVGDTTITKSKGHYFIRYVIHNPSDGFLQAIRAPIGEKNKRRSRHKKVVVVQKLYHACREVFANCGPTVVSDMLCRGDMRLIFRNVLAALKLKIPKPT